MAMTIKTVGVAGSGTMGAGIAIVAARAGFRTVVYDMRAEALARARKQTEGFFAKSVERKKLTQDQVGKILSGLSGTTDIAALAASQAKTREAEHVGAFLAAALSRVHAETFRPELDQDSGPVIGFS